MSEARSVALYAVPITTSTLLHYNTPSVSKGSAVKLIEAIVSLFASVYYFSKSPQEISISLSSSALHDISLIVGIIFLNSS